MMIEFSPFILGNKIDESVCDQLLDHFLKSSEINPGKSAGGVNPKIKDSWDLGISPSDSAFCVQQYLSELESVLGEYIEKYKWCSEKQSQWRIVEKFNIQMYEPGQAYHEWHCERQTKQSNRHLVFMTYLNDLKDQGGETEWYHQKLKIKPEKGLTLIWPVDWPFTHRGIPSMTETKYITTGWYSYY